jgi:hypothetical protein
MWLDGENKGIFDPFGGKNLFITAEGVLYCPENEFIYYQAFCLLCWPVC